MSVLSDFVGELKDPEDADDPGDVALLEREADAVEISPYRLIDRVAPSK